ncbi:MAG: zinc metalloprotease HtpX [Candidatus Nealsonbacteria bacterium RIFCSPLOWO2_01_FULL_41_9]|uniref:Protease HtpX homolog n=1 Tax=Candidatus Nealsonbacteria bacterium RIFCSPLOWO2_01_FULL_41_9 TaxID=1801671 RepID=A0A1G2EEF1_9BACT|nr:MAG: zinc metalloprotease HtpX [Candidatus Nealsonbacteria bacterium RIFCSPLOWO2_01_FULL_41_9]
MATIYTNAESNIRKTWMLISVFLVIIIGFGWIFSNVFQNPAVLIYAVIFSLVINIASFWYSDKVVLALTRAKPIKKQDNPELYRLVENLCITAGLPAPPIYILEEAQPNAFATGRDKKHAVIAVTRGLLEKLDKAELEGVISHELSHIGNKDMLLMTMVVVLVGFISIISNMFTRSLFFGGFRRSNNREGGQAGSIFALVGLVLAILSPIVAMLIQMAISRKREFLADASGALLTRYPEGLASALEKIGADKNPMRVASASTSHLFISNPLKDQSFMTLFSTHPPLKERIKVLRGMEI